MKKRAVIAGAGPAGLSSAIGLLRLGFSVDIFEERKEWVPRVCGSFLSPESKEYLQWLGIFDNIHTASVPCDKVRLHAGKKRSTLDISGPRDTGLAVPRKTLEEELLKQAESEGAKIHFGTKISNPPESDLFVAAGGRYFSHPHPPIKPQRGWAAFNIQYTGANQPAGELSLHFFQNAYVGTLTFGDGTTNVSGLVHTDFRGGTGRGWENVVQWMMEQDPALEYILKDSRKLFPVKGIPFLPFGKRIAKNQPYFSVGDSAAVCDPYMGEGISRALSSGPMIFQALENRMSRADWKESGWNNFYRQWNANYLVRQRLGAGFRSLLKSDAGMSALYHALTRSSLIQSWFRRQIHRPSAWIGAH